MTVVHDEILREVEIEAPIEKVWAAITQPEHLGQWFGDAGVDVDFRVGGEMKIRFEGHGETLARIEAIDEPRRFAWHWAQPNSGTPGEGNSTLVEFNLESTAGGTKLRLVETGFTKLNIPADKQASSHQDNTGGWEFKTNELKSYVEKISA